MNTPKKITTTVHQPSHTNTYTSPYPSVHTHKYKLNSPPCKNLRSEYSTHFLPTMNTVLGKRTIDDLQRQASELKDQLEKFNTTLANIASVANTKMQESEKRQKKRKKKSKKKTAPNSFLLFRSKWNKENKGLYPDYLERMDKVKQAWNELADEERIVFENEHNRLKRERDAKLENVYEPPRKKVKVIKKSTSKANVVVIRPSTPVVEEVTPVVMR